MPHLKPVFVLVALTLIAGLSAHNLEAGSLTDRDLDAFSHAETLWPQLPGIGPVAEPNGFRGDLEVGPVVEPNGWSSFFHWTVTERVQIWDREARSKGSLETHSSTIVEPNGSR